MLTLFLFFERVFLLLMESENPSQAAPVETSNPKVQPPISDKESQRQAHIIQESARAINIQNPGSGSSWKVILNWLAIILSGVAIYISYTANVISTHSVQIAQDGLEVSKDALKITSKYEKIRLLRDLYLQFNGDPDFKAIRKDIEGCKPLYRSRKGSFDRDQMNSFLNFFEGIGFLERQGDLDIEIVDNFFGAYLVEAFSHKHIQDYIAGIRKNASQPNAFLDFQGLVGKLMKQFPENKILHEDYKKKCT